MLKYATAKKKGNKPDELFSLMEDNCVIRCNAGLVTNTRQVGHIISPRRKTIPRYRANGKVPNNRILSLSES